MDIRVELIQLNRSIDTMREIERKLNNSLYSVREVSSQLYHSQEQAMWITGRKLEKEAHVMESRVRTIRTMHIALERAVHMYQENEEAIEDINFRKMQIRSVVHELPGISDRKWADQIQQVIRLKG